MHIRNNRLYPENIDILKYFHTSDPTEERKYKNHELSGHNHGGAAQ